MTAAFPWTDAATDTLKVMFAAGRTDREIAEAIGGTWKTVANKRGKLDLKRDPVKPPRREGERTYSDADIALLTEYYLALVPVDQIAAKFATTPRAVKNKVRRLGLVRPGGARVSTAGARSQRAALAESQRGTTRAKAPTSGFIPTRRSLLSGQPVEQSAPRAPTRFVADDPANYPHAVTLMDVREGQCRWPIGEGRGFDQLFCGAPFTPSKFGRSWCAACSARGHSSARLSADDDVAEAA